MKRGRSGRLNGGDDGQFTMVVALEVARNEGGMGIWAMTEGSSCSEMHVASVFRWMKGTLHRLIQHPNLEAR